MKLAGRYAVISGASRGLGAHLAVRFAGEGAALALCARSGAGLEETRRRILEDVRSDATVLIQPADVSCEEELDRFFQRVQQQFPRVDILVNCAGVAGPRGAVEQVDWAEWKSAVSINLLGTVYLTRLLLPGMRRRKYGKIINISGGGATKPLPGLSAYAAAKAAVVRFTETLAQETRSDHIDVNAVAPGVLATRMVDEFVELGPEILGNKYFEEVRRQKENPLPAMDRAADLCIFLASSESDGITGKLLSAVWDPWQRFLEYRQILASSDIYTLRRIIPEDRGVELS